MVTGTLSQTPFVVLIQDSDVVVYVGTSKADAFDELVRILNNRDDSPCIKVVHGKLAPPPKAEATPRITGERP